MGFRILNVCFNAEYCNKPGKASVVIFTGSNHFQRFNCCLFVWVCIDLPEIQDTQICKCTTLQHESMLRKWSKKIKIIILGCKMIINLNFAALNLINGRHDTHTCTGTKKKNKHTIT